MRNFEEINQEYGHTCAQIGSLNFQIDQMYIKISSLKIKLGELTAEAEAAKDADAKKESIDPDLMPSA